VWDLGIIVLDTPSREAIEISSCSCDLSIFSSKASSQCDKGTEAAPRGSSSASMGKLWPDVDKLDEISREGSSGRDQRGVLRERCYVPSVMGTGSCVMPAARRASINDTPGPSFAPPRGHDGGSARSRAARIISDAPDAVSPPMQRSFIDWQYSLSTGMDHSEWKIILEELTHMGYIVKKEPDN
jgi:hypothetical protein